MKEKVNKGKNVKENKSKALHIIGAKEFEQKLKEETMVFAMVLKEVSFDYAYEYPYEVEPVLAEFSDIFPEDLPNELPPMCDIQYTIDLVLGATLPNLPHYRMNATKHVELKRQVDDLLNKGFI